MKKQDKIKYEQEFDEFVKEYNEWLNSEKIRKKEKKTSWADFFTGLASAFNPFGSPAYESTTYIPCPFEGENLTAGQIDAIKLASDCKRIEGDLEKILAVQPENHVGETVRAFQQQLYLFHRDRYVSEKERN